MKCSILTTAGADPYYSATVLDAKRQGFEPVGFVSSGEPSKSEMNTNTRRALEWFLRTGDHHLLALDDDVCLGSGFRIAVERAMDLGFAAVTFGVFSKYLLGAVARRRALQGCLAMGFYPMANTKSKGYWGGPAMLFSKEFCRRMLEVWQGNPMHFDSLAARTALAHETSIYGVVPSPIRHMRMKSSITSHPRLQVISYRGVMECPIHGGWKGIELSAESAGRSKTAAPETHPPRG